MKETQLRNALLGFLFALVTAASVPSPANATTTPIGAVSLAAIGLADPAGKVPAINAIKGSEVSNISIAFPSIVLDHGKTEIVSIASQDVSYTGMCVTRYTLTATVNGKPKTIATGSTAAYKCAANNAFLYAFSTGALPDYPGAATLTATVSFGSTAISKTVALTIV